MSILLGNGTSDPAQMFFGSNPLKEVWVGNNKIWPSGPQSDAKFWFDFDDRAAILKNKGTTKPSVAVSGTFPVFDNDHVIFDSTTRLDTKPTTDWMNGYTVSMWTRDTPANSGWKTILHRAVSSGTLTNEAYIVHNTSGTTTTIVAGLKFGSVHREYLSNYSPPVSLDWFHTVVVWKRLTSTSYNCTIYINGVQRGSFNATGYASYTRFSTEQLYIGGNRTAGEWSGRMDDLLIWDRGLSASEVTELYNQGRSRIPQILTQGPFDFVIGESGGLYLVSDFPTTSWSATGLPDGITLSPTGYLSGSATTEGSGTMVVTASGEGLTATKSYSWTVRSIPMLPSHAITAAGANKISTSGWGRPALTWSLVSAGSGAFTSGGDLIVPQGKGRIRAILSMTGGKNSRIVSNQRGVLATGSGTNQNYRSEPMVFNEGERLYIEIQDYSGAGGDSFLLSTDLT